MARKIGPTLKKKLVPPFKPMTKIIAPKTVQKPVRLRISQMLESMSDRM